MIGVRTTAECPIWEGCIAETTLVRLAAGYELRDAFEQLRGQQIQEGSDGKETIQSSA